ncbi:MAG TPA: DUF5309 family protein [Clostridia bacterium]
MNDTNSILQAKRIVDMSKNIALLDPDAAPLTVLLKNINSQKCTNPEFHWLEAQLAARWDVTTSTQLVSDTSINVANGSYFSPGDIVKVPAYGEVFAVTSIASNVLTVVRGYGETSAHAFVSGEPLVIIGNANMEGAGMRTHKPYLETDVYNYTQIFRTTVSVTGTLDATQLYGGKQRDWERKKKGIEHLIDIERAFLFGERKQDTSGSDPKRTTRGLLKFLTANNYDAGGTLTEYEFETFCQTAFLHGSKKKLLLASPLLISILNYFARNKLVTASSDKTYGLNLTNYQTAHGQLIVAKHNLLEKGIYGGYGIVLDPENITYRYLDGRDTKLRTNIQAPDVDGFVDEYLTEAGLQVQLPDTHAVITNITGQA